MSAKVAVLNHYRQVEDIAKARATIDELRAALHDVTCELQDIATAYGHEVGEWGALIKRTKATLINTLPGADLDAMSKPQRRETLRDAITDIFGLRP